MRARSLALMKPYFWTTPGIAAQPFRFSGTVISSHDPLHQAAGRPAVLLQEARGLLLGPPDLLPAGALGLRAGVGQVGLQQLLRLGAGLLRAVAVCGIGSARGCGGLLPGFRQGLLGLLSRLPGPC